MELGQLNIPEGNLNVAPDQGGVDRPKITPAKSERSGKARSKASWVPDDSFALIHDRELELELGPGLPSQLDDLVEVYLVLEEMYQDFEGELGEQPPISSEDAPDPIHGRYFCGKVEMPDGATQGKQWADFIRLRELAPYPPMADRLRKGFYSLAPQPSETEKKRDELRNQIAAQHLGLVAYIAAAEFFGITGDRRRDLYQQGALALLSAVEHYDPNVAKFSSYAYKSIRGGLVRFIKSDTMVHIPEKATYPNVTVDLIGDQDQQLIDSSKGADDVHRFETRRTLQMVMDQALTSDEREIMLRRMGLDETIGEFDKGESLETLATERGVSRERIRQIEAETYEKICQFCERHRIKLGSDIV